MIRLLAHLLLLALAAGAGAMAMLATAEPPVRLPLVKADFPLCVRIAPPPLPGPQPTTKRVYPRRFDNA